MKFDVFLSHNGKDKPAVETLAHKLEERGFEVWLDRWNLIPGEPWQEAIEEALDECQTYAVFVGPSGIGPWENEEMRAAIEERVKDKKRRVIPVLLPGAPDNMTLKLPRFLQRTTWVDFRAGLDDEDALYRLECGIKGVAPGKSFVSPVQTSMNEAPQTSARPVSVTIGGNVSHANIIIGDDNQATFQPAAPTEALPLPTYTPSETLPPPGDLPLGSSLPFPPNSLFTGREAQLRALAEALLNHPGGGTVINQAVAGMGGVGKTQLAVEFAYRFGRYFRGVHWLNLADPSQLEAEIARCGRAMSLPNFPDDQPSQVTFILHVWKSDGPRLVILDNFEEPDALPAALSLLGHSSLRLLITSRRTDWPPTSGLHLLPLEVFSPAESLDFLRRALPKRRDRDEDLARLAEQLGHLPLALELAARYLNGHPRLGLEAYLEQCRAALEHPSMRAWRADLPAPTGHDLDLQATFALSWQQVQDETARNIFRMAGYLAPNSPIPLEIFERALRLSSEACDEALGLLYGLGLLKEGEDHLPAIHPLLAEYARLLARETGDLLERLADALGDLADDANETGLPARFQLLRPHLPLLAARAEEANLGGAGRLWNSFGYYLHAVADYPAARAAYERALKILEKQLGPDHPNVAALVNNLGSVLQDLGDLAGARQAFERALKIFEKQLGEDHPNVATLVNNLGRVLQDLGDLAGARQAFERALRMDEAAFGPDHPNVAIRVNNLGSVLRDLGDLAGARAAFERALRILQKFLPPDHPNIKIVQGNLDSLEG